MPIWYLRVATRGGKQGAEDVIAYGKIDRVEPIWPPAQRVTIAITEERVTWNDGVRAIETVTTDNIVVDHGTHIIDPWWRCMLQLALNYPRVAAEIRSAEPGEHVQIRRQLRFPTGRWRDHEPFPFGGCEYRITSDGTLARVPIGQRIW